jgi:hypothetical protein
MARACQQPNGGAPTEDQNGLIRDWITARRPGNALNGEPARRLRLETKLVLSPISLRKHLNLGIDSFTRSFAGYARP